ncbi:MAG TPA: AAA family ATPase [Candidatus Nanoarchaeia archaeon]|nr:AAA family ATPase [Candidatus Nanoarchaeia archaeon]
MKVICVTGTPGTGKTTVAKKLALKIGFLYLDINGFVSKNKLYSGYDKKRKSKIVDIKKLNKELVKEIKYFTRARDFFKSHNVKTSNELAKLAGHDSINTLQLLKTLNSYSLNGYFNYGKTLNNDYINKLKKIKGMIIDSHLSHYLPKKYVDLCIVTKCGISELNKRLKKRKYSKAKIKENLQAEIFDVCRQEALKNKHKVITVDTAKTINITSIAKKLR